MARRYGKLNRYRSRIRRCAISGLRGYEHEMIHKNGLYYIPRWLDEDTRRAEGRVLGRRRSGGGGVGRLAAAGENIIHPWGSSTPSATPSMTPSSTPSMTVSHTPSPSATPSATPSEAPWTDRTSDTYWTGSNAVWTGTEWDMDVVPTGFTLQVTGSWYVAYRPTKIRVTGTIGSDSGSGLQDQLSNFITTWAAANGAVEANLTFAASDIKYLRAYIYETISKIEFYEG